MNLQSYRRELSAEVKLNIQNDFNFNNVAFKNFKTIRFLHHQIKRENHNSIIISYEYFYTFGKLIN